MEKSVELKLKRVLSQVLESEIPEDVFGNCSFTDMGINSISFIKAIVLIEQEFDIEFEDDKLDFNYYNNINQLVSYVQMQISKSLTS